MMMMPFFVFMPIVLTVAGVILVVKLIRGITRRAGEISKGKKSVQGGSFPAGNTADRITGDGKKETVGPGPKKIDRVHKVGDPEIKEVISKCESRLRKIVNMGLKIKEPDINTKVKRIGAVIDAILDDFTREPKHVKQARQFVNYYLDATVKIIEKYVELSQSKYPDQEIKNTLERVEKTLDAIEEGFRKQLSRLKEGDLLILNTEIDVIEKSLKQEGF